MKNWHSMHSIPLLRLHSSLITVVEIHREAVEIQYIFETKWTYWKDLFVCCKTTWCSAIKKGIFRFLEAKYNSIFLKPKFLCEYQIKRTTFIKSIYISIDLVKSYLVKMCSIFTCSTSNIQDVHLGAKMYWILPTSLWNSKIVVTLLHRLWIFIQRLQNSFGAR